MLPERSYITVCISMADSSGEPARIIPHFRPFSILSSHTFLPQFPAPASPDKSHHLSLTPSLWEGDVHLRRSPDLLPQPAVLSRGQVT